MPGPLMAADAGKVRAMMKQRVHQRVRLVAGARMDHQPGRLVEHEQVFVFVENPERNFFGLIGDRGDIRLGQPNDVSGLDRFARPGLPIVPSHRAGANPLLQTRTRKLRQSLREKTVEAHAALFVRHDQFNHLPHMLP